MAELADAQRSGRCMGNHVQVRILFGAFEMLAIVMVAGFFVVTQSRCLCLRLRRVIGLDGKKTRQQLNTRGRACEAL